MPLGQEILTLKPASGIVGILQSHLANSTENAEKTPSTSSARSVSWDGGSSACAGVCEGIRMIMK